jgi:hypothetical protein
MEGAASMLPIIIKKGRGFGRPSNSCQEVPKFA